MFTSETADKNDKERLNAFAKLKLIVQAGVLDKDYLLDLSSVLRSDALPGFEIRMINQLTAKEFHTLPQKITQDYLNRILAAGNKVEEGEETLILTEELQ